MRPLGVTFSLSLITLILSGCPAQQGEPAATADPHPTPAAQPAMPPGHPAMSGAEGAGQAAMPPGAAAAPSISGKVLETMDAGGYTYAQLETEGGPVWVAGPATKTVKGEAITGVAVAQMNGFESKTLGRTFDTIFFASGWAKGTGALAAPSGEPGQAAAPSAAEPVQKLAGGVDVAEVNARSAELAGKDVALRGRVVKFNANILGMNWVHVQDGSGSAGDGSNDLLVTTAADAPAVAVGAVVVARGKVATDKDFGAGYKYAVLVDGASLVVE